MGVVTSIFYQCPNSCLQEIKKLFNYIASSFEKPQPSLNFCELGTYIQGNSFLDVAFSLKRKQMGLWKENKTHSLVKQTVQF